MVKDTATNDVHSACAARAIRRGEGLWDYQRLRYEAAHDGKTLLHGVDSASRMWCCTMG